MKAFLILIFFTSLLFSTGFSFLKEKEKSDSAVNRWYTKEQVIKGKEIFANNCALCHGYKAEKTIEWKKKLPDGSYPPPPLNDKAHAWHHPLWQLKEIINNGGASYDGKMPPFKDKISKKEIENAIAYFQSFWADEFYKIWYENGGLKEKQ